MGHPPCRAFFPLGYWFLFSFSFQSHFRVHTVIVDKVEHFLDWKIIYVMIKDIT